MDIKKTIKDYPSYEVFYDGRVFSHKSKKFLKPINAGNGYYRVELFNGKGSSLCLIHRLVAEAFIENKYGYKQINHIDEDKSNNHADNLEWCSSKYNMNYGTRNERASKSKNKPVRQIDLYGNLVNVFESAKQANEITNISRSHISNCCHGKRRMAGGYKWSFDGIGV